jgi:hypothetical protein
VRYYVLLAFIPLFATIQILLPQKAYAVTLYEASYSLQDVGNSDINTSIYGANNSSSEKMSEYVSAPFVHIGFSSVFHNIIGIGLRYDMINTGTHTGKFTANSSTFTWTNSLKASVLYLTVDRIIETRDFLLTFGAGVGYTVTSKFISEYTDSTVTAGDVTYENSKTTFSKKTFSFLLNSTYSWVLFEVWDLYLSLGYRYLNLGEMKATKTEGTSKYTKGDPYEPLENSVAAKFDLSGPFIGIGMRFIF